MQKLSLVVWGRAGITVLGESNLMTVQVMNFLWMVCRSTSRPPFLSRDRICQYAWQFFEAQDCDEAVLQSYEAQDYEAQHFALQHR